MGAVKEKQDDVWEERIQDGNAGSAKIYHTYVSGRPYRHA